MVRRDLRLASDHIYPCAPYPTLPKRPRQRMRIHKRPPTRVHQHGRLLHPPQKALVDEVRRRRPARREHEDDVALRGERVEVDAPQRL